METAPVLPDVIALVDCGSLIVRQCERRDLGNARLCSRSLRSAVDLCLDSLNVIADAESAGKLLRRFPSLRELHTDRLFSGLRSYTEVVQLGEPLQQLLASLTRLSSLSLSSSDLQQLGHLKWAHRVLREATRSSSSSSKSSSSSSSSKSKSSRPSKYYKDEYAALANDSQHLVYWMPDWLAAAPGLTSLAITPPASYGVMKSGIRPGSPACLWMNAAAWSSKLTSLDITGVQLGVHLPPSIPQLTCLTSLKLQGCGLRESAAAALVRQVGASGKALRVLGLARNELWQLPREGWEGLAGLKELDLSCNYLAVLPGGVGSMTALTGLRINHNQLGVLPVELTALSSLVLFDASHNWLSGFAAASGAELASLVAAWPCLQSLALANTSDKHGSLALPQELASCSGLRHLKLGSNYALDWASLRVLLQCTALQVLDLTGTNLSGAEATPPGTRHLLAQLQPKVAVRWDSLPEVRHASTC